MRVVHIFVWECIGEIIVWIKDGHCLDLRHVKHYSTVGSC